MKKAIVMGIGVCVLAVLIGACKNPPIFAAIEQEVKLKPLSLGGTVRALTRVGDTLYSTNGFLYTKQLGQTGSWKKVAGVPESIGSLASDGTKLYFSVDNRGIYTYNGTTAEKMAGTEALQAVFGDGPHIYASDQPRFTETSAQSNVYKLNGTSFSKIGSIAGVMIATAQDWIVSSAGLYRGTTRITDTHLPNSGFFACLYEAGTLFVLDSQFVYAFNGTAWKKVAHKVKNAHTFTFWREKHRLLIGGSAGYGELVLDASDVGDLSKSTAHAQAGTFDGSSTPPKYYNQYINMIGKWPIANIYLYSLSSNDYVMYATVGDPNTRYSGLWGFYQPKQLEWNRE